MDPNTEQNLVKVVMDAGTQFEIDGTKYELVNDAIVLTDPSKLVGDEEPEDEEEKPEEEPKSETPEEKPEGQQ